MPVDYRLRKGAYVGDVTALCVLPLSQGDRGAGTTAHGNSTPEGRRETLLVVGVGASLQCYHPVSGKGELPILVAPVFSVARIHGIVSASSLQSNPNGLSAKNDVHRVSERAIIVWGERRVALVGLYSLDNTKVEGRRVRVLVNLPPRGNWVHDVIPLAQASRTQWPTIAVGLADNCVEQWTVHFKLDNQNCCPQCLRRVECSMPSMLYTLALRGTSMANLEVVGGTIFNEVQVWKIQAETPSHTVYQLEPFAVFRGHEGSIMRVSWASRGNEIYSTSDDRTACIWAVPDRPFISGTMAKPVCIGGAQVTVFGHTARVWDCKLMKVANRSLMFTAGEDCTVRIWELPCADISKLSEKQCLDRPVAVLRGHKGRGVWRILPLELPGKRPFLLSAGADASIKLWNLSEYSLDKSRSAAPTHAPLTSVNHVASSLTTKTQPLEFLEVLDQNRPVKGTTSNNPSQYDQLIGSSALEPETLLMKRGVVNCRMQQGTGEHICALCLASPAVLYAATTSGLVHRIDVDEHSWRWRNVYCSAVEVDIISLAVLESSESVSGHERLAIGDARGRVVIVSVSDNKSKIQSLWQASRPVDSLTYFRAVFLMSQIAGASTEYYLYLR